MSLFKLFDTEKTTTTCANKTSGPDCDDLDDESDESDLSESLQMWNDYTLLGITLQHYDDNGTIDQKLSEKSEFSDFEDSNSSDDDQKNHSNEITNFQNSDETCEIKKPRLRTMYHIWLSCLDESKNGVETKKVLCYTAKPGPRAGTFVKRVCQWPKSPTEFHFVPKTKDLLVHFFDRCDWRYEFCNDCRLGTCGSMSCLAFSSICATQQSIFAFSKPTDATEAKWYSDHGWMYKNVQLIFAAKSDYTNSPCLGLDETLLTCCLPKYYPVYALPQINAGNVTEVTLLNNVKNWLSTVLHLNSNCSPKRFTRQPHRYHPMWYNLSFATSLCKRIPVMLSIHHDRSLFEKTFQKNLFTMHSSTIRVLIFGPPQSGKSFIALNMAMNGKVTTTEFPSPETSSADTTTIHRALSQVLITTDVVVVDYKYTSKCRSWLNSDSSKQYCLLIIELSIAPLLAYIFPTDIHSIIDAYGL